MTDEDAKKAGDQLQAHLDAILDAMDARDAAARREATAATILAALIQTPDDVYGLEEDDRDDEGLCRTAVTLADALRAELAKGRP